jgi:hypothetical protein
MKFPLCRERNEAKATKRSECAIYFNKTAMHAHRETTKQSAKKSTAGCDNKSTAIVVVQSRKLMPQLRQRIAVGTARKLVRGMVNLAAKPPQLNES